MRTFRCYHPQTLSIHQSIQLTPDASHQVATVLRARLGQAVELFDDSGYLYQGVITALGKSVRVDIQSRVLSHSESPLAVHLVQAVAKNDKIDWVLQKAVELGVHEITLVLSERTEMRVPDDDWLKKMSHWQGVILHAAQQSGRAKLPRLNKPQALASFWQQDSVQQTAVKLLLHVKAQRRLRDFAAQRFTEAMVIIGPEGGFSEQEVCLAEQAGCQSVLVGPRVLRTETAPLAILSVLQYLQGDF